jgi:lysophospholipase L1-like esterase
MKKYLSQFLSVSLLLLLPASFAVSQKAPPRGFVKPPLVQQVTTQIIGEIDSIINGYGYSRTSSIMHQLALIDNANSFDSQSSGYLIPYNPLKLKTYRNYGVPGRRMDQFVAVMDIEIGNQLPQAALTKVLLCGGLNDLGGDTAANVQNKFDAVGNYFQSVNVYGYYLTVPYVGSGITFDPAGAAQLNAKAAAVNDYLIGRFGRTRVFRLDKNLFTHNPATAMFDDIHFRDTAMAAIAPALREFLNDNYAPVRISAAALPNGIQNVAYSQLIVSNGGSSARTAAIVAGALPSGWTLTNSTISGTTTQTGNFSFTVRVKDSFGNFDEKQYSIAISAPTEFS